MMDHLIVGLKDIYIQEIVGSQHNPKILAYFKKVGHDWVNDDETAWCAAYLGYCLEEAGLPSTGKLNARSYLEYGEPVEEPEIGDIAVLWRGSPSSWQGHTGIYINQEGENIRLLSGNTSNEVNISNFPKSRVLGYRRPIYKQTAKDRQIEQLKGILVALIVALSNK